MLRISKLTDYATVLLAHLAEEGAGMRTAVELDPRKGGAIPSTKGVLGG